MKRINACFNQLKAKQQAALIPFITAGDPSVPLTVTLMHTLVDSGADIIELGMPFSDPMADGPVIQRASERALAAGTTLYDVLHIVSTFRQTNSDTPVVLMGYVNPVENMGYAEFAKAAHQAGVDGILLVDLPPEEIGELGDLFRQHELDPIFLLSPTTTHERIARISEVASGYLYYVSLKGVTGSAKLDTHAVAEKLRDIRSITNLPIGVGFGIRDAESAAQIAQISDAVIVGSALLQQIEQADPSQLTQTVTTWFGALHHAVVAVANKN
ncbi:tryptophan synthase subunit alpha [Thioflexithrix psekupsensis]|uniref:Tryptophan synthase alpha chain n=1 Tax=Thioflexithrix psekupsensis TaxID=1570016 RepID=A0A251XAP6_9GAMM|nr:tryptophan synthase subunit alpha [Thioflexithrix psekupsensis]OUD15502.1 tryptophan synthase subunit alpha [Thioflexithrix psekupsensis]